MNIIDNIGMLPIINNYPKFAKSDNNILEFLDELTFGKPEKAFDALEFFKDEGYDTNSDSELESDNEFVKIDVNNFKASKLNHYQCKKIAFAIFLIFKVDFK